MKLSEFEKYSKLNNIRMTSSEELELKVMNDFYEELRTKYFYRVFETYYKDAFQCLQFYCTGFINSEDGYEYLLTTDVCLDDVPLDEAKFDLYVELEGSDRYERKDKHIFTGTLSEILKYSQEVDKQDIKEYYKWNNK